MTFDTDLDHFFKETHEEPQKPVLFLPVTVSKEEESSSKKNAFSRTAQSDRTIFVGNVDISVLTSQKVLKEFKGIFAEVAKIESIRFRSIPTEKASSKKHAVLTKRLQKDSVSCNCYIVFVDVVSVEKALEKNGTIFMDKHLRIDRVDRKAVEGGKKSIFIGNLPFDVKDEEIWNLFCTCGDIESVRVVRDAVSSEGKGIAFVNFKERSSVLLALKLNDTTFRNRNVRVTRYQSESTNNTKNNKKINTNHRKESSKNDKKIAKVDSSMNCKLESRDDKLNCEKMQSSLKTSKSDDFNLDKKSHCNSLDKKKGELHDKKSKSKNNAAEVEGVTKQLDIDAERKDALSSKDDKDLSKKRSLKLPSEAKKSKKKKQEK